MYFTPIIVAAHPPGTHMFQPGTVASTELQTIAEGGDVGSMATLLQNLGASVATGDGLLAPGGSASFTVEGSDQNSVLSLSAMILPTNDGFVGLDSVALPAGSGSATFTYYANGYDAGTEANDELVGSGAPGEAGFPAPPPVVASGTGTGGSGVSDRIEGSISVHKGTLGDLDPNGGASDINSSVHGWLNPIAQVTISRVDGGTVDGPGAVSDLRGLVYSSTALELFWERAVSEQSPVVAYDISRDGQPITTVEGQSFFEDGLEAGTTYVYGVRAVDANGATGEETTVTLTTNSQ